MPGHDEGRLADVAAGMVDALHQGAAESGVDVEVDLVDEFRAFRLERDSRGGRDWPSAAVFGAGAGAASCRRPAAGRTRTS